MYETLFFFPLKVCTQGLRFLSLMASLCYGELSGGPGGTPSYKPNNRYVPPQRVGFLRRFGLKTGIDFAHFGLESGMVFVLTT